jgi:hypothetical protein
MSQIVYPVAVMLNWCPDFQEEMVAASMDLKFKEELTAVEQCTFLCAALL